jgi:hypothetical protein
MATLRAKPEQTFFDLKPTAIADDDDPIWISVVLELVTAQTTRLRESFSLTVADLRAVIEGSRRIAGGRSETFELTGLDENFYLRVDPAPSGEEVYVGFWLGEPYQLMRGYRMIASKRELQSFAKDLEMEQGSLEVPG